MGLGVPKSGPGSVKDPLVLKGDKMHCPKCGKTDNIWRNDIVPRSMHLQVDKDGSWDFSGNDNVHWDSSCQNEAEPEFFCRTCDVYFEAPNTICASQKVDVELTKKGREAS
jgi:hypothetical protein